MTRVPAEVAMVAEVFSPARKLSDAEAEAVGALLARLLARQVLDAASAASPPTFAAHPRAADGARVGRTPDQPRLAGAA